MSEQSQYEKDLVCLRLIDNLLTINPERPSDTLLDRLYDRGVTSIENSLEGSTEDEVYEQSCTIYSSLLQISKELTRRRSSSLWARRAYQMQKNLAELKERNPERAEASEVAEEYSGLSHRALNCAVLESNYIKRVNWLAQWASNDMKSYSLQGALTPIVIVTRITTLLTLMFGFKSYE